MVFRDGSERSPEIAISPWSDNKSILINGSINQGPTVPRHARVLMHCDELMARCRNTIGVINLHTNGP